MSTQNTLPAEEEYDPFPGGTTSWGYRFAFQAWMALFLLTICAGLVNFLMTWINGFHR